MRKSIAVIFMIVGILIIASPFAWEEYQEWQRDKGNGSIFRRKSGAASHSCQLSTGYGCADWYS